MSDGLYSTGDTAPYTSEVLTTGLTALVDGTLCTYAHASYWMADYSYGIDLVTATPVTSLECYCVHGTGDVSAYYTTSYDSFKVLYSNDNSSWTLIEQFDAPPIFYHTSGCLAFRFTFTGGSVTARYFKIVCIDLAVAFTAGASGRISEIIANVLISTFSGAAPTGNIKVYGGSQQLQIQVATYGSVPSDIAFYKGNVVGSGVMLGTTQSGVPSSSTVSGTLPTISGAAYSWYVAATVSGITDYSSVHSFYVRYLCSGTCSVNGTALSGVIVHLHTRATGELVGTTTTAGGGTFNIDSTHMNAHYVVALPPTSTYNGLIYDRLIPE